MTPIVGSPDLPGSLASKLTSKEELPVPKCTRARENSFPEGVPAINPIDHTFGG